MIEEIKSSTDWINVEKIQKGWSSDDKYHIITKDNHDLLLRISDISKIENKKEEFEFIEKLSKLDFLMSTPLEFGVCYNRLYKK